MWMPVFPAIFERVAGNLLSVDGSATQLPSILLDVDSPIKVCLMTLDSRHYIDPERQWQVNLI